MALESKRGPSPRGFVCVVVLSPLNSASTRHLQRVPPPSNSVGDCTVRAATVAARTAPHTVSRRRVPSVGPSDSNRIQGGEKKWEENETASARVSLEGRRSSRGRVRDGRREPIDSGAHHGPASSAVWGPCTQQDHRPRPSNPTAVGHRSRPPPPPVAAGRLRGGLPPPPLSDPHPPGGGSAGPDRPDGPRARRKSEEGSGLEPTGRRGCRERRWASQSSKQRQCRASRHQCGSSSAPLRIAFLSKFQPETDVTSIDPGNQPELVWSRSRQHWAEFFERQQPLDLFFS